MAWKMWLALFRQTALPIIGENLTDAWMLRAVPLAHEFPVTRDCEEVQWTQGSYAASAKS